MKNISKLLVATLVLGTAFSPLTAMAATPTVTTNTVATTTTSATPAAYADLIKASAWAQNAILQAKQLGLMAGDPDGNFRPQDKMTRQEFAAILSRLLELNTDENTTSSFADVPSTAWGIKYIEAVKAAGIMVGDGNGSFRPNALISREELAVTLVKAAEGDVAGNGANLSVADKDSVSAWAKDYVQTAIEMGLMRGDGEKFNPKQNSTREQAAVVAINFVDYKLKPAVIESAAEGSVTIKGKTYTVADSLKGLFAAKNSAILKDAKIKFDAEGNTLTGITTLEIVKGGQAAEAGQPEFSGNLTLDGDMAVLGGDLKVSANYVSVNNLTVEGNLEISQGLENDFSSDNLTVNGKTLINGGDTNTVVFTDATLRDVEVNKSDVRVEYKNKTVVGDVTVNANATIVADSNITLPKVTVKENVDNVEIDAVVTALEVKDTKSKLDFMSNTKIDNLVLPTGAKAQDVVKNFDQNKGKFSNLNGAKNPDAPGQGGTIPGTGGTTPNNGGTTPGGTTPPGQGGTTPPNTDPFTVQLLSTNDLHGKIDQVYEENISGDSAKEKLGGMDYLATYLKQREATNPNNTLIVHAGDAVGGSSPVSSLFREEPTVELMNYMGFDLGTIGNHELDKGTVEMLRLTNGGATPADNATEGYEGIKFPMIAANVVYKSNGQHVLPPSAVKTVNGVKIGFVGVVTKSAAGMVMPAGIQDIEFTDETTAVNDAVAELKQQGVEAIIVLAHMDATQSGTTITGQAADLANAVDDEVDIIMAAHNHKLVNGTVDGKLIVQAYEYGKAFADVDFKIDPVTKDIIEKSAEVVYVDRANVTPDATASAILSKYSEAIKPIMEQVVGDATIEMVGGYSTLTDNALGNLIADSMRAAMNSDFAMMNGGGIRSNINAGDITWGELYNILPFNNILTKVEIKGADLFPILEAQLGRQYGGDYSVSGLKFVWNTSTLKVESITLPNGTPVDPTATYTLTVNNFMQTSTSSKYKPIGQLGQNPVTGPEDLAALVDFVENYQGPLAYQADGRIAINDSATATNNVGAIDTLAVTGLTAGNVVKVYASANSATVLAQATVEAGATSATVTGLDFGANGGQVYFTVSSMAFGKLTEGPKIPKTVAAEVEQEQEQVYDAVVAEVIDGDTIKLVSPVLGATNVRFLNIDTPETYHSITNDLDQNQLDQGTRSKNYMKTLLHAGDAIKLKVGVEPKDGYGRLLAEVIRTSDNMNVNLEQVKTGNAAMYYIWPIDSTFAMYSAAQKHAVDNQLGIWNQQDPLLELPFVFRAREQKKAIFRYVANAATNLYVSPQNWAEVPVEQRIFFNSLEEVEAAGYTHVNGIAEPFVNSVEDDDTVVTGKTKAGAIVTVSANGVVLGTVTAGTDGLFSVTIDAQSTATELSVIASIPAGTSGATKVTVVPAYVAPAKSNIADVRTVTDGTLVTIEGVVTVGQGTFANDKTFYVQDGTAAIYIYQSSHDVAVGQKVKIVGKKKNYYGQLELEKLELFEVLGTDTVPAPTEVSPAGVNASNQDQVVVVKAATISDIKQSGANLEFMITKGTESTKVFVPAYTGLTYANFTAEYKNGDMINVTGISTQFNGAFQVKPRGASDLQKTVLTDAEAIAADKAALQVGYATGDSATGVTQAITLPAAGNFGTTISWSSSNEVVIANNGTVTRPATGSGNQTVTLTATISKSNETPVTKTFDITVLEELDANLPVVTVTSVGPITIGDSVVAKSNKLGTLYLVSTTATPATQADLDALVAAGTAKSATVTTVDTDTTIATADLATGDYKVYAVSADGYVAASTASVTLTAPVEEPKLLITEVLVRAMSGTDLYEYIEVYNNSTETINLKDYKLSYPVVDIAVDKMIAPGATVIICTKPTTLSDFNTFYGVALTEDQYLALSTSGLANSSTKLIQLLKDSDGTVVIEAQYEVVDVVEKKSVTFKKPVAGAIRMEKVLNSQTPTPGTVDAAQK